MVTISTRDYAVEMKRIEEQRNAALRQGDAAMIRAAAERRAALNQRFWRQRA